MLFQSHLLNVIDERRAGSGDTLFVTFQSATKTPGLHREGFGQKFLREAGIPAFHFVPAHNLWYQHNQTIAACALVLPVARTYRRVVTYGSSMGGFAALNFARLVGATDAIAISPQYSINPEIVPFETRYLRAHEKLSRYTLDAVDDLPRETDALVLYDPVNRPDALQAELIESCGAKKVPLHLSGHPVTSVLPIDALKRFVLAVARDGASPAVPSLVRDYRATRSGSPRYFLHLAKRYAGASRARRARIAEQALRLDPEYADAHLFLGNLVLRSDTALAATHLRTAMETGGPDFYPAHLALARALLLLKRPEDARAVLRSLRERKPNLPGLAELEASAVRS